MIWLRFLILTLAVVLIVYYAFCILQLFGLIKFTKEDIKFFKMLIPFYYFFKL